MQRHQQQGGGRVRPGSSPTASAPFLDDDDDDNLPISRVGFASNDDNTSEGLVDIELEETEADAYELFDFNITADKHSLKTNGRKDGEEDTGGSVPIASSWIKSNITIPNRLALATMGSIIVYEVLVVVSMGVNSLRYLLAAGLMHFLLFVNGIMILSLAAMVYKSKRQLNASAITKMLKGDKRVNEDDNNGGGGGHDEDEYEEEDEMVEIGHHNV